MTINTRSVMFFFLATATLLPEPVLAHGEDDPPLIMLLADQIEFRDGGDESALSWDASGWFGKDLQKLWLKTEGERVSGETEEAELQFLYSKAVATYWDLQVGVRHDFQPAGRTWVAMGVHGLAPYFFETDVAFFVGESGRTALRLKAEYEILLTQRLIISPELEINIYGQNDLEVGVGSGLSDIDIGIHARYEIRREIAPYIGVHWLKNLGNTADLLQGAGIDTSDTEWVVGIRLWF